MQAQRTKATAGTVNPNAQLVSKTQSLAAVQTLLRAGISCITFLRNLLPEDNFTETHLTASDESFPSSPSETDEGTPQGPGKASRVKGFRIKTLTRGYTDEADRLLNYLESGIFDALQKQYLRSFIFAIYLDSKDPTNIVEAYTFNFKYHSIPGSDTVVPVMSLGDDLGKMSLNGRRELDPVADAIKKGRLPTIGDVKKSLRTMMKTLIQAITHMDELPRHRFATFKLFYTDQTPDDYEPPLFQSGDEQKDKWYFMTHNLDEAPDRFSAGKLSTGYHTVSLKVTSIASYLPCPSKDDSALFAGTVSGGASKGIQRPRATPADEVFSAARQIEQQVVDAAARNYVWSTEDNIELSDADAEGEDDPDYVRRPDGTYEYRPVGVRNTEGEIEPLVFTAAADTQSEAVYAGIAERVPTKLKEIGSEGIQPKAQGFQETQALVETQPLTVDPESYSSFTFNLEPQEQGDLTPKKARYDGSLPPSNLAMELDSPMSSVPDSPIRQFDPTSSGHALAAIPEDTEMLDLETQPVDTMSEINDSIQSFSLNVVEESETIEKASSAPKAPAAPDHGLQCDCSVKYEDDVCFCEGGCAKWYHVWCMGFHSADDPRLPDKFICFDCRLKADATWPLIKDAVYNQIMEKWKDFVTFRRAIKVAETSPMIVPAVFAKPFDGDTSLARRLIQRLEEQDFIHTVTTTVDDFGFATETRAKSHKAKDKKARSRKNAQKSRLAFNKQIKLHQKYKDHFTPDPAVEARMIGLDNYAKFRNENEPGIALRKTVTAEPLPNPARGLVLETQTQEETQILPPAGTITTRVNMESEGERPSKRMKISLALGIDLAE